MQHGRSVSERCRKNIHSSWDPGINLWDIRCKIYVYFLNSFRCMFLKHLYKNKRMIVYVNSATRSQHMRGGGGVGGGVKMCQRLSHRDTISYSFGVKMIESRLYLVLIRFNLAYGIIHCY